MMLTHSQRPACVQISTFLPARRQLDVPRPGAPRRIWRTFALQPHHGEIFKLWRDPLFIEKVRDIVGLYLNPPEQALVLYVNEKAQSQALDRTQPLLPMRPAQIERRTRDYERYSTTSLFAALEMASGQVLGELHCRHRAVKFRQFLDMIDASTPAGLDLHLILDNYGTHKMPLIQRLTKSRQPSPTCVSKLLTQDTRTHFKTLDNGLNLE